MKRREKQAIKRNEAEERNAARAKRSDADQLARLDSFGFDAKRERARLAKN